MTEKEYRVQPMIVKDFLEKMKIAEEKAQKNKNTVLVR